MKENIQHLYPLIKFTNHLIQTFNNRIERETAKSTKLAQFLEDHDDLKGIYNDFENAWFEINLTEVYFNQKRIQFQRCENKFHFSKETNISLCLLNTSNRSESILLVACLQTIANFHNDCIDYFNSHVINDQHLIPLQSIQQKNLLDFDTDRSRKMSALMINYEYGMSEEIIYDFKEIESTLRNEISCLSKIDLKTMRYFNYQFEFYDENMSLINDIRQRFSQKFFEDQTRKEIQQTIASFDNISSMEISGSLEYILTYLRNVNNPGIIENLTIESFVTEYIHSNTCISENLKKGLLASMRVEYIIDLYEINEESIFEKIISKNIRYELSDKAISNQERTEISQQFLETIVSNETLAEPLKDLNIWISMFKRLLVRLLLSKMNINFESSIYNYIKRSDVWKGNISAKDIDTIEGKSDIRLKYAFVILIELQAKLNEKNVTDYDEDDGEPRKPTARAAATTDKKGPISRNDLRRGGRRR